MSWQPTIFLKCQEERVAQSVKRGSIKAATPCPESKLHGNQQELLLSRHVIRLNLGIKRANQDENIANM